MGFETEDGSLEVVDPGSGLPYGQVPWWFSAIPGAMTTDDGVRQVMVHGSAPRQNVSSTTVTMSFDGGDELAVVEWARQGTGQVGYADTLRLRRRDPDTRDERLRKRCGESDDLEIV